MLIMSKTFFISQEGPANALSLNKDYSRVVIAGRNVFKIFSIEEDDFIEICNLRVGKNINLNYSCNDVAWSSNDDHILATAATNGAVVVWNLNRPTRSKQDHVFSEHKRTVNKVCFSLIEPYWLMSGSQDGTMKMFDLRTRESVRTFVSNTESVRDVQFSPQVHSTFASVSENGNVQTWDVRKPDKCLLQFTAHSGPVFSCDWHPEQAWLATASRDKTIKVWDMTGKPTVEHIIHTIASVGRVKWRPQYRYQIGCAALVVDSSINIWDVRRPYIPYATFVEHRDITTCIAWRDPFTLLSTSRDCTLYQHAFKDAVDLSAKINPHALAVSSMGQVAFACRPTQNSTKTSKMQGILKKVGNIATGVSDSEIAKTTNSSVYIYSRINKETEFLVACANRYILNGKPLSEICQHNASVALELSRFSVSQVWLTVKAVYSWREEKEKTINEVKEKEEMTEHLVEENYESKIGELLFRDCELDPLSSEFEDDEPNLDWTLPQEAFPLRTHHNSIQQHKSRTTEEGLGEMVGASVLNARGGRENAWEPYEILAQALHLHASSTDVQTPVCVLLALGSRAAQPLMEFISQDTLETWVMAYLELLSRFKLWLHSNEVIKCCWLPSVNELNQESTTIHTGCSGCNKSLTLSGWNCSKCNTQTRCTVCHNIVRGMYVWCQGCMHGGHIEHMYAWIKKKTFCPTGCGHACEYS